MSSPAEGSSSEEEPVLPAPATPAGAAGVEGAPEVPGVPGTPEPGGAPGAPDTGDAAHEEAPGAPAEEKRRYPSTIGGAFYLVILAVTVAGLVIAGTGDWRTGVHWMAGSILMAAVLRFVLPQRDAGMLAVRARWIDVTLLGTLGILLWVLASNTPNA